MIEFVLLYSLGFLSAGLLALLVAPVIQRRVVRFAEDRLKATMPISPAEVRAQKDAVRAAAAAEQAKTLIDLRKERDRGVALMVKSETLAGELKRTTDENRDLQAQIARMSDEAADMRVALKDQEKRVERLKEALDKAEEDGAAKARKSEPCCARSTSSRPTSTGCARKSARATARSTA